MDDIPRQKLCELLAAHGPALARDPRRCAGLLRDHAGTYKREIKWLTDAMDERVSTDLQGSAGSIAPPVLLAQPTQRLEDNLGLNPAAASWTVESWAMALGVIPLAPGGAGAAPASGPPAPRAPSASPSRTSAPASGPPAPAPFARPPAARPLPSGSPTRPPSVQPGAIISPTNATYVSELVKKDLADVRALACSPDGQILAAGGPAVTHLHRGKPTHTSGPILRPRY